MSKGGWKEKEIIRVWETRESIIFMVGWERTKIMGTEQSSCALKKERRGPRHFKEQRSGGEVKMKMGGKRYTVEETCRSWVRE